MELASIEYARESIMCSSSWSETIECSFGMRKHEMLHRLSEVGADRGKVCTSVLPVLPPTLARTAKCAVG